jgi:transcription elongation factor GreA
MTQEGYAALTEELVRLERDVRPEVTAEMARAAADKDFRENAPYDAAKQRLSEVQGRINTIRTMLSAADIHTAGSNEHVDLGMTVILHDLEDNEAVTYTVVGPGEVNLRERKISAQSPLGSALMNKRLGDVVEVSTPAGSKNYRIDNIEMRQPAGVS